MKEDQNDRQQELRGDETPIYVDSNTTLQTPAEHAHDKSVDPRQDTAREASKDDLHETANDRLAGSDRAGTFERKDNNMSPQDENQ